MSESEPEKIQEPVGHGHPPKEYQFKPGQSGNPAGSKPGPRGKQLSTLLSECMEMEVDAIDPITKLTTKMKMSKVQVLALLREGSKGNTKALQIIFDRLEGAVPNKLNLGNADGEALFPGPISLEILSVEAAPAAALPPPTPMPTGGSQ